MIRALVFAIQLEATFQRDREACEFADTEATRRNWLAGVLDHGHTMVRA